MPRSSAMCCSRRRCYLLPRGPHFNPKIVISNFKLLLVLLREAFRAAESSSSTTGGSSTSASTRRRLEGMKRLPGHPRLREGELPGGTHYVIASFFTPEIRSKSEGRVTLVPPILRVEILRSDPHARRLHVLVYQTSTSDKTLLRELRRLRRRSSSSTGSPRRRRGQLRPSQLFRRPGFSKDLASAR